MLRTAYSTEHGQGGMSCFSAIIGAGFLSLLHDREDGTVPASLMKDANNLAAILHANADNCMGSTRGG